MGWLGMAGIQQNGSAMTPQDFTILILFFLAVLAIWFGKKGGGKRDCKWLAKYASYKDEYSKAHPPMENATVDELNQRIRDEDAYARHKMEDTWQTR